MEDGQRGWGRSMFEKLSLQEEAKLRADSEFQPHACAADGVTCAEYSPAYDPLRPKKKLRQLGVAVLPTDSETAVPVAGVKPRQR